MPVQEISAQINSKGANGSAIGRQVHPDEQAGAAVPQASQGQVDTTSVRTITAPITLAPRPEAPPASNAAKKKMGTVQRYYREFKKAGMLGSLFTVMPKEKFPCIYQKDGTVTPQKWAIKCELTEDQFKEANNKGAGVATRGDDIFSVDYDGENPELGAIVDEACDRLGRISPKRERAGSNSFLREFMQDISDPVLGASSTHTFRDKEGNEHSVEFRGQRGIFVLANFHKSGVPHTYKDGKDIPAVGLKNLSVVTNAMARSCEEWLIQKATEAGFEYVPKKSSKKRGSNGEKKSLDDPSFQPSTYGATTEDVLSYMKLRPNTAENNPNREDWLWRSAAIKAALGADRENYYADYEEWSLQYEENTETDAFNMWRGINDARLGYEALARDGVPELATKLKKFEEQRDFAGPVPTKYLDAPANSNEPKAPKPNRKRLAVLTLSDLGAVPEPDDFIEGTLCAGQLSLWYGDTNIGKSFVVQEAALRVAAGQKFFGRDTEPGAVIYIAGEGAGGMKRRITAYLKHHGIADPSTIPFVLVPDAVDFRDKHATDALIEAARQVVERFGTAVRWIIVDTLSRALAGGNENAPDDMGALVRGADRVRLATGAHLTFIHHTGKDETKGARGHSLLRAAVDTELEVKRQEGAKGVVCVNVTKQRDLEIGAGFAFRLVTVDLGTNRRGKPITSCVVEPAVIKPVLTEAEAEAVQILQTLLFDSDAPHVELAEWRKAIMSAPELLPGQTPDAKTKQWQRLRDGLKKKGIIVVSGGSVWVK